MFPTVPRVMCAQQTVLNAFPLRLGLKSLVCRSGHPGVSERISLPCLNGLHFREKKNPLCCEDEVMCLVWGTCALCLLSPEAHSGPLSRPVSAQQDSLVGSLPRALLPPPSPDLGLTKDPSSPQSRECLVHLFRVFCFRATPSNAQGLLLTPCSGITPGSVQGILSSAWH